MLALTATTDAIEVVLGEAHTTTAMQCYATWRDITTSASTPGRSLVDTTGTTTLDLVTGPGASTSRIIDTISAFNADTVQHATTLKFDANGTEYKLVTVTLQPGEVLLYSDEAGWTTYTLNGAIKEAKASEYPAVLDGWTRVVLGADVTDSAGASTYTDITGLSFAVTNGTRYWFRMYVRFTPAASTTGGAVSINGPATTALAFRSRLSAGTSSSHTANATAYDIPAAAPPSSVTTVSGNLVEVQGFIQPSADGTVIGRVATEVDTSAIVVKAGSYLQWKAV